MTRNVTPTMIPPSSASGGISAAVSEWISATAPVPAKKIPQASSGQANPLGRRPGRSPRVMKMPAEMNSPKIEPTRSSTSVPVPSGHSFAIT
jgi:hypothetical protein